MKKSRGKGWQKIALNIPGMEVTLRVAVVLAFFALCEIIINISPVEAYQQQGGSSVPPYLEQLDGYRHQTLEHFRLKEEQKERSRILENSVQLHLIKRGETLSEIAVLYGVEITALAHWNNLANPNRIREGEVLHVLTVNGTLHHVEEGDTLSAVASRYNVESQKISDFNLLDESQLLVAGNKLVIPDSQTLTGIVPKEPVVLTLASRVGGQAPVFRWPLVGRITSFFGMRQGGFHYGLDVAAPYGSEVQSAASGLVEYTGVRRGYGLMLTVDHGNGWGTLYAHNSLLLVESGQRVTAGQPLALVGSSGNATGPHLHFEIMHYKKKLDPLLYLP